MFSLSAIRAELGATLRLAAPVVAVQVGIIAMGVVDTIMVGHVSAVALAAVALGNLYYFTLAIFAMGTLLALDPIVTHAIGAGDAPAVGRAVQRGLALALALSVLVAILLLPAAPVLAALRQPPEIIPDAARYALVCLWSTPALLAFVVFRQSLQAMHRVAPIVVAVLAANAVNVALNWVFVFGHLGSPAMGAVGSAWATLVSRWVMTGALLWLARREIAPLLHPLRAEVLRAAPLLRMLRLGLPIGAQQLLEYGAFGLTAILMGWFGAIAAAGHQVALNLASLTFMVPLGVGAGAAVRVGHAVGRGDRRGARSAAWAALALGTAFMCVSAVVFLLAPHALARLYTNAPAVLVIAASLIPIAGLFQIFDGLQAVSAGILRGLGDTRAPLVVNVLGFWLIGLPVSAWFGFRTRAGPIGLWWGFVAGLAAVALFLILRVRHRLGGELRRVRVDEETAPATGIT